jgi:eukaryotic-like serine/threonine-protein kinase
VTILGSQDTLAASSGGAPGPSTTVELERGELVGRYTVLGKLGAGGMGVVYAAYDPELDRKVALKLLHASAGSEGRPRMLREAQALAKLSHPNVVAVHDLGTIGERVWLAMEFVAGQTLRAWLDEHPRGWREILEVMRPAALGLAAAHASGLVHRDVKPDNVMLAEDGRVRVMDFGLARALADASETASTVQAPPELHPHPQRRSANDALTQTGALAGTPAYMAPEQLAGLSVDASSDQFSWCVMLWEALYRVRPFAGDTLLELAANVLAGKLRTPPGDARVPSWLRSIVNRGLAQRPEARWPSMPVLLHALDRGQARARRARVLLAFGGLVIAGTAVLGGARLERRHRVAACEAAGERIAEVWNDDARARLRDGMLATGSRYAELTADKTIPWLDAYADAWQSARSDACLDTEVTRSWDADLLDRATWCLDERRFELAALVSELTQADDEVLGNAITAAAKLPRVEVCRDSELQRRLPPPPTSQRDEVQVVREELARVGALERAGKYLAARERAEVALEQAVQLQWPPLIAAARLGVGSLRWRLGDHRDAEAALETAYFEAKMAGVVEVAAACATQLVAIVGDELARRDEGMRWSRHAELALGELAHGDQRDDLRRAALLGNVADLHWVAGEYDEAERLYQRVLTIREHVLPPDHPELAQALANLGNVQLAAGEYEAAAASGERALVAFEHALGPEHPRVAGSLNNLAAVHLELGEHAEAKLLLERALAVHERSLGPGHPFVAVDLSNIASIHRANGELAKARALTERSLAIREAAFGPDHPEVAQSLENLAIVLGDMGEYPRAEALDQRALAISEHALGPDHVDVARILANLGNIQAALGELTAARGSYERALRIWEASVGTDHPHVGHPLYALAEIALAQHRPDDAMRLAEHALRIRESGGFSPEEIAEAHALLARASVH